MNLPKRTQVDDDPSRQRDADGSVRPTKDTGYRAGQPAYQPRKDQPRGVHGS